jgi:hypothetical protein
LYDSRVPRPGLPPWIRRAVEGAIVAAVVAVAPLLGDLLAGPDPHPLATGIGGALQLAPAVLALGVIATAYPVAMAATRADALLGAIAALLVAADVTLLLAGGRVLLPTRGIEIGGGLLAAGLALGPALLGLVAGQLATPLGFGRRAGGITAVVAAAVAVVVLAATAMMI